MSRVKVGNTSTKGTIGKHNDSSDDHHLRYQGIEKLNASWNRKYGRAKTCGSRSDREVLPDYKKEKDRLNDAPLTIDIQRCKRWWDQKNTPHSQCLVIIREPFCKGCRVDMSGCQGCVLTSRDQWAGLHAWKTQSEGESDEEQIEMPEDEKSNMSQTPKTVAAQILR